jgi:hypothetical protein
MERLLFPAAFTNANVVALLSTSRATHLKNKETVISFKNDFFFYFFLSS